MSSAAAAKLKGIKLGAEPRKVVLLGGLLVVVIGVFIYNSSDTPSTTSSGVTSSTAVSSSASQLTHPRARKRNIKRNDHNTLRMQEVTVEAQQGQIDPTLRLDLLERLKAVKLTDGGRNLFAPDFPKSQAQQMTAAGPRIMPAPLPAQQPQGASNPQMAMQAPIPLKFFGFAAPANGNGPRRGFFLDGDDVLVVNEGDTVKGRYRIVSLDTKSAQVEDITANNKQVLSIVPEQQIGF